MSRKVLVVAEHRAGALAESTLEAAGAGLGLGGEVTAALLAADPAGLEGPLLGRVPRLEKIIHPGLAEYNPEAFLEPLSRLIQDLSPGLVLMAHTSQGMDLAPALAGRLGLPLATGCTRVEEKEGAFLVGRPVYGGKLTEELKLGPHPTVVLTLQTGAFAPPPEGPVETRVRETVPEALSPRHLRRFVERLAAARDEVDITAADILVSVGRGIGSAENIERAQALADRLGATLACSRPVADAGWLPKSRQVGTSGQSVRPKVYLALGISGAFQHLAGIGGAQTVIAVNKDPKAPIFQEADYGLVADLFQVLDQLAEAF